MQLRNARLCLDCEEVHEAEHCPACTSESFAFITRWVPLRAQDFPRHHAPEPSSPEALATYRELLTPPTEPASPWRHVKRGALGLAIVGLAGWAWRQRDPRQRDPR